MKPYVVLIRGINVGGKNKISMSQLKISLEKLGFLHVSTYIASGNVILKSDKPVSDIKTLIEQMLPKVFKLDSELIKVLVLSSTQIKNVIGNKPEGFGEQSGKYHSDVIFLIDIDAKEAFKVFNPKEGVDKIWIGGGVIYSQRLSMLRTKSRLNRIMVSPAYQSLTIRNWNTTLKLLALITDGTYNTVI